MNAFPESKTNRILEYLISRSNEEISVGRMAADLGIQEKVASSIASRLVSRGIIERPSRGVYVHRQTTLDKDTIPSILRIFRRTIDRAFGSHVLEKTGIREISGEKGLPDLIEAISRTKKVIGKKGALSLLRMVVRRVASPSEFRYIMAQVGATI